MGRHVIAFIVLGISIVSSSCNSAKNMIDREVGYTSVTFKKKCLEIHERLAPRQYEGSSDISIITLITDESINIIPEWCFSRMPKLKEVLIKGKDVVVEPNAFYACKNLQKVNLDNVIKCGENAFKMTSVDSVNLNRCEYIEDFAFANCKILRYASFSDSLKYIGDFAFSSDTALIKINVPNGEIGNCSFMGCTKLKDVTLGGVSVIGESAFLDCSSLCEITIPESVIDIKSEAFAGCSNLKVVNIANRKAVIANDAFDNKTIIKYRN